MRLFIMSMPNISYENERISKIKFDNIPDTDKSSKFYYGRSRSASQINTKGNSKEAPKAGKEITKSNTNPLLNLIQKLNSQSVTNAVSTTTSHKKLKDVKDRRGLASSPNLSVQLNEYKALIDQKVNGQGMQNKQTVTPESLRNQQNGQAKPLDFPPNSGRKRSLSTLPQQSPIENGHNFSESLDNNNKNAFPRLENQRTSLTDGIHSFLSSNGNYTHRSWNRSLSIDVEINTKNALEENFTVIRENWDNASKRAEFQAALKEVQRISQLLLKINGVETDQSSPSFQHRPGSYGLGFKDINDLLFDGKIKTSEGHIMIVSFIKRYLLCLKKNIYGNIDIPILIGLNKKSRNAANLIKWIDADKITDSPILNMLLYKQALTSLIKLFEMNLENIRMGKFLEISEKNKSIQETIKEFGATEKIAKHFYKINACLYQSFDDEGRNQNGLDVDQNIPYFIMRYNEIIKLYTLYINDLEKLINFLFLKDERFDIYFPKVKKGHENSAQQQREFESDKELLSGLCKNETDGLGFLGNNIPNRISAGRSMEWEYVLLNNALEIFDNRVKKNWRTEPLDCVEWFQVTFGNIISVFSTFLQVNNDPGINALKEYFIMGRKLGQDFELGKFLEDLGFEHKFNLADQQIQRLQHHLIDWESDWIRMQEFIPKDNIPFNEFLELFCKATKNNNFDNVDPKTIMCRQFEMFCQILYLVEADEKNTKRETLLKLLMVLKFVNQDSVHTYAPKFLNMFHQRITGHSLFGSLKDPTRTKPTKKFKFYFDDNKIMFRGTGYYHVNVVAHKQNVYLIKECMTIQVLREDLLDPTKWRENYEVEFIAKEPICQEMQEDLNVFHINLLKYDIPYKIRYSERPHVKKRGSVKT